MPAYTFLSGQVLTAAQLNQSFSAKADVDSPTFTGTVNLYNVASVKVNSSTFRIEDSANSTKKLAFNLASIPASTTVTLTIPSSNITIVGAENTQTISGAKTFSNTLTMSGKPINEAATANVASASNVDLSGTPNFVTITGTTQIVSFTIPNGAERTVTFQGSLILTHSSGLELPGSANITTGAGDCAIIRGQASGSRVISFQKKANKIFSDSDNTISPTYYKYFLPGGIMVQGGIITGFTVSSGGAVQQPVSFPTSFSGTPFIKLTPIQTGGTDNPQVMVVGGSVSSSGFTLEFDDEAGGSGNTVGDVYWEAVGQGTP